ncbi:hypothetical protein [Sinanaerobacter sp. ZZT-01]|uniref:hypothetical protein n=1 Tax=Sinanaerobacter sp. ZZT-01 TaxID=3111540 RepID=UPI002D771608|nr:hypothetical protein [Sinanaerobacter sp. ZZT-01]WRR94603.1 hypothetical protein U5921_05685 [Sinanaerobacter sp. ZZT-01]
MAIEQIKKIKEAEEEADELRRKATAEAKELRAGAEKKAQELLENARYEADCAYKKRIVKAEEEAKVAYEVTIHIAEKESRDIIANASVHLEDAAAIIVGRVVS